MRSSPLRDSENGFLCLLFPVLLQVFWLHLRSLFLTLRSTPVLFASVPPFASTRPPLSSKQAAQKNERHSKRGGTFYAIIFYVILSYEVCSCPGETSLFIGSACMQIISPGISKDHL